MKKAKRITAALISAAVTFGMTSGLSTFAVVSVGGSDEAAKLLEGYTQIEDPAAFEMQEYNIDRGSSYFINESGNMMVIKAMPNSFVIEVPVDYPDDRLEETVYRFCPEAAEFHKGNASTDAPDTKIFEVIGKIGSDITMEMAENVCREVGDSVVGFKYFCDRYQWNQPQYQLSNHKYFKDLYGGDIKGKYSYTMYEGLDNQEKLQAFIDQNDISCHIELHETVNAVDVVPDSEISYIEEIQLAGQIYKETGLKPGFWMMAASASGGGSEIDMHNSVEGDSNCDGQLDMADAVLIMQSLANPNKHSMTAQGRFNADLGGDGITTGDALTIQRKLLGLDRANIQGINRYLIANGYFIHESSLDSDVYPIDSISFGENGEYYCGQKYFSAARDWGTWTISGDTVVLTGQFGTNRFRYEDNALIYIAEGSDGFNAADPKDGEKFYAVLE